MIERNPNDPTWFDPNTWENKDGTPWTQEQQDVADRIWAKQMPMCRTAARIYARWVAAPAGVNKNNIEIEMIKHVRSCGCRGMG